jgi:hypothetical protein
MYIYLDEAGDLGFDFSKPKTTKRFVITLLVCQDHVAKRNLEIAVRRTVKNKINRPKHTNDANELKGTHTTIVLKKYFLKQFDCVNWHVYSLVLNKIQIVKSLPHGFTQARLYNYLARDLIEKLPLRTAFSNVRLIVDRSKSRDEIRDFNTYIKNHVEALLPLNTSFQIEHLSSCESAGLQAADLFCWGIFRKHETSDFLWYREFSNRIMYEKELFWPSCK